MSTRKEQIEDELRKSWNLSRNKRKQLREERERLRQQEEEEKKAKPTKGIPRLVGTLEPKPTRTTEPAATDQQPSPSRQSRPASRRELARERAKRFSTEAKTAKEGATKASIENVTAEYRQKVEAAMRRSKPAHLDFLLEHMDFWQSHDAKSGRDRKTFRRVYSGSDYLSISSRVQAILVEYKTKCKEAKEGKEKEEDKKPNEKKK